MTEGGEFPSSYPKRAVIADTVEHAMSVAKALGYTDTGMIECATPDSSLVARRLNVLIDATVNREIQWPLVTDRFLPDTKVLRVHLSDPAMDTEREKTVWERFFVGAMQGLLSGPSQGERRRRRSVGVHHGARHCARIADEMLNEWRSRFDR